MSRDPFKSNKDYNDRRQATTYEAMVIIGFGIFLIIAILGSWGVLWR